MSVVLKNTSKKMQIHDLPHDDVCEGEEDGCLCTDHTLKIPVMDPDTGEHGTKHVDKTISDSVHIAVGEKSRALPDKAVEVPSIKAAIARKELCVDKPATAPVAAEAAAEPTESVHESA